MATQTKFQDYVNQLVRGVHNWAAHSFKVMLVNSPAPVNTNTVKANLTEIAAGNGYTAGGVAIVPQISNSGGVATIGADAVTIAAAGGSIGPFRYAVLYNDTPTSPADPLVSFIDYGSSITLAAGESLDIVFNDDTTVGTINTTT